MLQRYSHVHPLLVFPVLHSSLLANLTNSLKDLRDLSALFEVAIAYGTGYLALDIYKYRERLSTIEAEHVRYSRMDLPSDSSPEMESKMGWGNMPFLDSIQLILKHFSTLSIMPRWKRILFESPNNNDKKIIFVLTVLNVISLVATSTFSFQVPILYGLVFLLPAISVVLLASFFAHTINKMLENFDSTVSLTYETYRNGLTSQSSSLVGFVSGSQYMMIIASLQYLNGGNDKEKYREILVSILTESRISLDMKVFIDKHAVLRHIATCAEFSTIIGPLKS